MCEMGGWVRTVHAHVWAPVGAECGHVHVGVYTLIVWLIAWGVLMGGGRLGCDVHSEIEKESRVRENRGEADKSCVGVAVARRIHGGGLRWWLWW